MKERYKNLDGIRAFSALGILCMHVLILGQFPENTVWGGLYRLIAGMGVLVQLFFMLSGFGMCCGYYEKMKSGTVDLNKFFSRRYAKIWPFFTTLVCIDILGEVVMENELSRSLLYEAFASITLLFGFLPGRDFQVMGIGWTLGVIFGFYCLFPFFIFAIWTKKRAWFSLLITLALNYICKTYFATGNMAASHICLQWMCCFVVGGVIYLYKDNIMRWNRSYPWIGWGLIVVGLFLTLIFFPAWGYMFSIVKTLAGFAMILIGALSDRKALLSNRFTRKISDISLEIYLSHVVILRILQKIGIICMVSDPTIAYIMMVLLTFVGAVIFARIFHFLTAKISRLM